MEPQVHVTALVEIVRDLLAGGPSRWGDGTWLREHAAAAGLDAHERAVLEELRLRLGAGDMLPSDIDLTNPTKIWL